MSIELKVPAIGESITEVLIGDWLHQPGDWVDRDQPLVAIDTDKVTVEILAPEPGRIASITLPKGATARIGDRVGLFEPCEKPNQQGGVAEPAPAAAPPAGASPASQSPDVSPLASASSPAGTPAVLSSPAGSGDANWLSPAARRALAERAQQRESENATSTIGRAPEATDLEEIVAMTPFRQRVAERLVESQQSAALLTTFNEVDMSSVQRIRGEMKDEFQKKYGVKLGLMSFFVRATVEALKAVPIVNAEVRGTNIVYKNHYDIGVAVGGERGLVVPILRGAERLGFSEIEKGISDFAERAKHNKLLLADLQGGTFTISNGGVYGSMLSTPIVNPPQSGILGLHAITERPMARAGQVVILPMMYVALTYDHRIVDGKEAVTFLRLVKQFVEDPIRVLLEL